MDLVVIICRLLVGAVLLYAGFAKLRSRRWPILAMEMGTPRPVVITLPAIELFLGLALVLQVGGVYVAWIAVVLFLGFTAVVTSQYASGSELPCNCFGGDGEEAINKLTIVRNVVLLLLAVVAALA